MAVSSDIAATYAAYLEVAQATAEERIQRVRRGLSPALVVQLAHDLRIPDHSMSHFLGISRAALRRRIADDERLTAQESEGPLAMALLAGRVVLACQQQTSGDRIAAADPLRWLGRWIRTPVPDLDGRAPIQYMDVGEGRLLVAEWLTFALSLEVRP